MAQPVTQKPNPKGFTPSLRKPDWRQSLNNLVNLLQKTFLVDSRQHQTPKPTPTFDQKTFVTKLESSFENATMRYNKRPRWTRNTIRNFILLETSKLLISIIFNNRKSVTMPPSMLHEIVSATSRLADDVAQQFGATYDRSLRLADSLIQNSNTSRESLEHSLKLAHENTTTPSPQPAAQSKDEDETHKNSSESSQSMANEMTKEAFSKAFAQAIAANAGDAISPIEISNYFLNKGANKTEQQAPSIKVG